MCGVRRGEVFGYVVVRWVLGVFFFCVVVVFLLCCQVCGVHGLPRRWLCFVVFVFCYVFWVNMARGFFDSGCKIDYSRLGVDRFGRFDRFLMYDSSHVVIVGGGITGLSAAFSLQQVARDVAMPLTYTLIERDSRLGGKIRTDIIDGANYGVAGSFVVEGGPDSFVTQKPWGVQLARDLGLGGRLMGTNEAPRTVFVLMKGRRYPMPDGMMLVVPTRFGPFVRSRLLSLRGKARMALDLCLPPRRDDADESLADFIRRRLGREALDRLAEPLLSGIHSAESERQSLLATFPRFRDLERRYGSIIRGMLAQRRAAAAHAAVSAVPGGTTPFMTLRGGTGELVQALIERLEGDVLMGCGVAAIGYQAGAERPYVVQLDDGRVVEANVVIMSAPAFVAADLVAPFAPALADGLRCIRYVSTGTISLAYRCADFGERLPGFGLLIPHSEGRRINACTMTSIKFAQRAPDGCVLVRVFVGGSRHPGVMALSDDALLAMVRSELRDILGLTAMPLFSRVYRWSCANPQYDVGHVAHVDALERWCPEGLLLAGSAYRGVGIPDCVHQGQEAAARAVALVRRFRGVLV